MVHRLSSVAYRPSRTAVPDLTTSLCGIALKNPTVLASGVLGTCKSILRRVARAGAGAVTIKSISEAPRGGHPNPTILTFEAGLINAVGYSNAGLEEALQEFASLDDVGAPVIASVIGTNAEEFCRVAGAHGRAAVRRDRAAAELPAHARLRDAGRAEHAGGDVRDHLGSAQGHEEAALHQGLAERAGHRRSGARRRERPGRTRSRRSTRWGRACSSTSRRAARCWGSRWAA